MDIDFPIYQAGSFYYYITYAPVPDFSTERVPEPESKQTEFFYIDISPNISLHGQHLPLDALSVCSILSKFMGKNPEDWNNHLRGIGQRGYNMVHFTPLVTRGESNSPYSIYDQLQFDPEYFPNGEKDVADLIKRMEEEYGLLALTDVVWNHTANNSPWLQEHPEAGYNCVSAPHLEAAYELDTALLKFGDDLAENGYPTELHSQDDLLKIMDGVRNKVIPGIKLWQYYVIDVEKNTDEVVKAWKEGQVEFPNNSFDNVGQRGITAVQDWGLQKKADWLIENALVGTDSMGARFRRRVHPKIGAALLSALFGRYDSRTHDSPDERTAHGTAYRLLDECNLQFYREYDADVAEILEQVFNRTKYVRLDDHGPKLGPINEKNPFIETYFTRLPQNETTSKHDPRSLALVNNGWVWAADAMRDNAGPKSRAYLRREVIVWGDCVKLRYGSKKEDNPWLWDHMQKYTTLMAKYFKAFRIDNCHSTPINLAEYMLDCARGENPNLAVFAELFTGSEEMDFKFCKRLGISALIREAMQAWSTQEMSRLVHKHCGVPIGSFDVDDVLNAGHDDQANGVTNGDSKVHEEIRVIKQSPVHAMFMDCTHDNEVPAQKRDARDTLPNAALVAMCGSAIGSVMGYDECYPQLIELVHETRLYTSAYSTGGPVKIAAGEGGIGGIKKLLNQIHVSMGREGYDECFIHHDNEYITVHRVHPQTRRGYFLIAHTAYPGYGNGNGGFPPVHLPGTKAKLLGAWNFEVDQSSEAKQAAIKDKVLRGLPSRTKDIKGVKVESSGNDTSIQIPDNFPPGSIALFETKMPGAEHSEGLDHFVTGGAKQAFQECDLIDLNLVLYRCEPEERDLSKGQDGTYTIPGHGPLIYAGLQGWISPLRDIIRENNLGHPICNHIREGPWAMDYCVGRLERLSKSKRHAHLRPVAVWFRERFEAIKKLASFLWPRYFAMVMQTGYAAAVDRTVELMSETVKEGQQFMKSLALVSLQVTGYMNNCSLWPEKSVPLMAAGLPHFASDWARCWGRDTFISLRGLYIGTGRWADAREHFLAFASVVKHGMIPNLLSSAKLPRYNSRDSVWFFLQNIQDYTILAPKGIDLLKESTKRRFEPYNDEWFPWDDSRAYAKSSTIEDVIQEIMQRHAEGMSFREYNAGPNLDMQMSSEGFQIDIKPDWSNGLIFGGNQHNCGTWMDKMGESEKAGSKGVPGSPRDGCAIEIAGMLYSTVKWLAKLNAEGKYKYSDVSIGDGKRITFAEWEKLIKDNFEHCFYVPREKSEDSKYDVDSSIVNRRGIYKDLYRGGKGYEDYQLRPNYTIAMSAAPDLFDTDKALYAIWMMDQHLRGPTGMATLDPGDFNYRPNYINSDDSTDFHTAKGRNYHNGPEWLWPTGFFLRAMLHFGCKKAKNQSERTEVYQQVTKRLAGLVEAIKDSPWAGLTELTNKNGSFCGDSVSFAARSGYLHIGFANVHD